MRVLRVYHAGRDPAHRQRERALTAAGVDLTLVVPRSWSEGGAERVLSHEGFPVVELDVTRSGDVNRHRYEHLTDVRRVLYSVRPDVLDLHEEPFSAVARQWLRAAPADLPVVAYSAQNIDKRWPPPFSRWERQALARLSALYPCSRQAASVLRGKGFGGRLEVLPLGVDAAVMHAGRQQHDDVVWTLLLVGRLVAEKGVQDAVRVLARLRQEREARLVVVGQGPEGELARRLAKELGVAAHLDVRAWTDQRGLAELYRQAHVTLVPSHSTRTWVEQFGRVITEGQASGSVIVGYASGSIPEVASGLGLLADEGDSEGLAEQVVSLSRDPHDYSLRRAAGLARAVELSWPAVARRQVGLYESVLDAPGRAPDTLADRERAVREFGPPAQVAGGGRPFALPVLRQDRAWTRALARGVDAVTQARRGPGLLG